MSAQITQNPASSQEEPQEEMYRIHLFPRGRERATLDSRWARAQATPATTLRFLQVLGLERKSYYSAFSSRNMEVRDY